jgi:hypothetical protein
MFRKLLIGTTLAGVLAFGIPTPTSAQQTESKQEAKKAKKEIKRAGKDVKDATKETGRAVKHSAKAAGHKVTPSGTRVRVTCNDGKIHHGRTRAAACAEHGGVRG